MQTFDRFDFVAESVALYLRHTSSNARHNRPSVAVACFEYTELVLEGVHVYERICRLDNDWRMLVFRGSLEYEESHEKQIAGLFQKWLANTDRLLAVSETVSEEYLRCGFDQAIVDQLHSHCREVRGAEMSDEEFFGREETFSLANEAIHGETVEIENLGE